MRPLMGKLEILVKNDEHLNVNPRAVIRLSAAVLQPMLERRHGVILNIASVAGPVSFPARAAYSISKAAVIQVTRARCLYLSDRTREPAKSSAPPGPNFPFFARLPRAYLKPGIGIDVGARAR
jgi:uncharacterized protein